MRKLMARRRGITLRAGCHEKKAINLVREDQLVPPVSHRGANGNHPESVPALFLVASPSFSAVCCTLTCTLNPPGALNGVQVGLLGLLDALTLVRLSTGRLILLPDPSFSCSDRPRRRLGQMPGPNHLAPVKTEDQQLFSELPSNTCCSSEGTHSSLIFSVTTQSPELGATGERWGED